MTAIQILHPLGMRLTLPFHPDLLESAALYPTEKTRAALPQDKQAEQASRKQREP